MSEGEYPGSISMLVDEQRVFINQNDHIAVVLHKTASPGTAQDIADYFATNTEEHSVHYVVGQDGTVVQCVLEKDGAGGNCCTEPGYDTFWSPLVSKYTNLNLCTLSIEHCDPRDDNSTPLTAAQKDASFKLVRYLIEKYHIPVENVKKHQSIDPISRARCPGNYPFDELVAYLESEVSPPVTTTSAVNIPAGWHDDGKTLTAPNGFKVVLGFRDYVLNHNWLSTNYPLMDEQHADVLYETDTGLGGGQYQIFLDGGLAYNTKIGVVPYEIGREFLYLLNLVKEQATQINNLNVPTAFITMLSQLLTLGQQTLDTLKNKPQGTVASSNEITL